MMAMEYRLGLVNIGAVIVSLILILSPLADRVGEIHPLLIIPFIYMFISVFLAALVVVLAIKRWKKENRKMLYFFVVAVNGLYLCMYVSFCFYRWDILMSI